MLGKKRTFIFRHILHQNWYTYPNASPVRRNPHRRSLLTSVSATSAPPIQPLRRQRNVCHPAVNRFTRQTFPTVNRTHFFINILCIESFCPQRSTIKRCSSVVQTSSMVAILTTETSLWTHMCVCYVDCHKDGPCCYVVTHRNPITSIEAVSLPFVTYSLTLSHSY
jgi:hypothetical protein